MRVGGCSGLSHLASVAGLSGAIRGALPPGAGGGAAFVLDAQVSPRRLWRYGRRDIVVARAFCRHGAHGTSLGEAR